MGAGRRAAPAGCARLLGAPAAGGRRLAQTEPSSGKGSVCRAFASSGAQPGGAEDPQWPPEAAAPLQAGWCVAPSEGLATPSRDRCPAARAPLRWARRQPPAQGPLATFFGLEMCYTFRVDNWASVCNRWQQTEQEKAFITLQPAVTTAWIDGCNQPTASVLSGSSPGALPCHLRTEGIVTLPPAHAQLGRGSQPHSSDRSIR